MWNRNFAEKNQKASKLVIKYFCIKGNNVL